jgi:transcription initiation factor TFIID TATA-box-binding protein
MSKRQKTTASVAFSSAACGIHGCDAAGIPQSIIHNIVGTAEIHCSVKPIDLQYIFSTLPNSFYDRKRFAAITIRIMNPMCTALLFTSGKLVITGTKTYYECILAALRVTRMLQYYCEGISFMVTNTKIQNVVAHVAVPLKDRQRLNIDRIYKDLCTHCTYQKNMFPGLIFRPDNCPVVLLCFFSGKIVITGGKCSNDIYSGWESLWPIIKTYIE